MDNEKQTANNSELEQSPQQALAEVSGSANEIIDNPDLFNKRDYNFKTDTLPDGNQSRKLASYRNGASLEREFNAETGDTTYSLSLLYHGGADRGSFNYTWLSDGESVLSAVKSELNGVSDKPELTSAEEIKSIQTQLEKYFPSQKAEEIPVAKKKTFGGKLLTFLGK